MEINYLNETAKGVLEVRNDASKLDYDVWTSMPWIDRNDTAEWESIINSTESLKGFQDLGEYEAAPVVKLQDGYKTHVTPQRKGSALYISADEMQQMDDGTTDVKTYFNRQYDEFIRDAQYSLAVNVHDPLNEAFSSTKYLAPDGQPLGSATHAFKDGTVFDNLTTDVAGATAAANMETYEGEFVGAAGKEDPKDFDTIIVKKGSAAEREFKKVYAEGINPTKVADVNVFEGQKTIFATPFITTANKAKWFGYDSRYKSCIMLKMKSYPSVGAGLPQNNGSVRYNLEAYWEVALVGVPQMFYCSNA